MGAFFTNVHVRVPEGRAETASAAILECLTRLASEQGLLPCEEGAHADRGFVVGPAGPWIGVFDEATESQDVKILDDLAERLSVASGCAAVAALVHDSDHLLLRLFDDGHLVDEVDRGKKKGKIEHWSKVVAPEKQAALRGAFTSKDLLAEETLVEIATILGVDAASMATGYRYLTEEGQTPEGVTHLRFRLAVRPAYEQLAEGPPRPTSHPIMVSHSLAVGGALFAAGTGRNEGGRGRSFYVVTHGPAIEAGLIEPTKARVSMGHGPHRGGAVYEAPAGPKTLPNGRPSFFADFPEGEIPASNAGGLQALQGLGAKEGVERMMRSQIQVVVEGRGIVPGEADLYVSLVSREAREHPAHFGYRLTVSPTPRRPLRGHFDDPTHYIALATPEAVVALAVSRLDKATAAPIAAEIVERWSELWPRDTKLEASIFGPDEPGRPKKPGRAILKVEKLAKSASWKRLRTAFGAANCVGADQRMERQPGERRRGGDSFAFGDRLVRSMVQRTGEGARDMQTLRLVVSIRGRTDVPEVMSRARTLVDEFVQRGQCIQAVLMRCRTGQFSCVLDHSEYEEACGIHGQFTLRDDWCSRFLRGVGADGIWLGPELLARIDREALESLCHVEPVGETLRVVLREGATLDALENVLAPLLPTEADWKTASQRANAEVVLTSGKMVTPLQ